MKRAITTALVLVAAMVPSALVGCAQGTTGDDAGVDPFDTGTNPPGRDGGGGADGGDATNPDGMSTGEAGCTAGGIDEPDSANTDSNCDGIDGDANRAVFVSEDGVDGAMSGTKTAPFRSIRAALEFATRMGKTQILVSRGMYTETMTLRISEGIGIYGGYDRRNNWSRGMNMTTLQGASVALEAVGIRRTTGLGRLVVRAADAMGNGAASVALRVVESPNLVLGDGLSLNAGRGSVGAMGTAGTVGSDGAMGANGGNGNNDDEDRPGAGGAGGMNPMCPTANGGTGGGGGGSNNSYTGRNGEGTPLGGTGGMGPGTSSCTPMNGTTGGPAPADGMRGGGGTGGAEVGTINVMSFEYVAADGGDGVTGEPGSGGGGGSGSSGQNRTGLMVCNAGAGNGGGGGGAGGCGGTGGHGGGGGGASIGLLLVRSPVMMRGVSIATGGGGAGGAGGPGGAGGGGAMGGAGGTEDPAEVGLGGRGADGRRGGEGGGGGGGGGGPSIGIWIEGGMRPMLMEVTYRLGEGGLGGSSPAAGMSEGRRGAQRETQPAM